MSRVLRVLSLLLAVLLGLAIAGAQQPNLASAAVKPTITSLSSKAGPLTPTKITIRGKGLAKVNAVKFGSKRGSVVRKTNATTVEVRTPKGAKSGTVSVRVRVGKKWSKTTSKARYTFVAAPTIKKLAPTSGTIVGGQTVTITGSNLAKASKVVFGSAAATITSKSATKVVVRSPIGVRGATAVKVTTLGGTSRGATYTYVRPAAKSSTVVTPAADAVVASGVEWVTGGQNIDTNELDPWTVGLKSGSSVPTIGDPFVVKPGTAVFPSGLAGTVSDVAVQGDGSVRVVVAPTDLSETVDRLKIDYAGSLDAMVGGQGGKSGRSHSSAAASGTKFSITGPTQLSCKNDQNQPVTFGADLSLSVSDIDVSQRVDLGSLVSRPSYDGSFSAEIKTTGKITAQAKASCKLKPEWQNANRRVFPIGTTGLTISFAPAVEIHVSAKGTWTIVDRTRTTFVVNAELGKQPVFSRTTRSVESSQGGALTFHADAAVGVSVQFGVLDRSGMEAEPLLGVAADLTVSNTNVCVNGKVFLKLNVSVFLDVWVERWEKAVFSGTIDLRKVSVCARSAVSAPPGEPQITSGRLADARVAEPYSAELITEDGRDGTWTLVSPLPAGLTLARSNGLISGTPTGPVRDYPVTVDFKDLAGRVATSVVRIQVLPARGISGGDVQVTLNWTGPADLDLHLIDPNGEEIYYRNTSSTSGGQLDHDANAGCNGPEDDDNAVENIFWPPRSAPAGAYVTWVHVYDECAGPLDWHLVVRRNGAVILDQRGTGESPGYQFNVGGGPAAAQTSKTRTVEVPKRTSPYPPK